MKRTTIALFVLALLALTTPFVSAAEQTLVQETFATGTVSGPNGPVTITGTEQHAVIIAMPTDSSSPQVMGGRKVMSCTGHMNKTASMVTGSCSHACPSCYCEECTVSVGGGTASVNRPQPRQPDLIREMVHQE